MSRMRKRAKWRRVRTFVTMWLVAVLAAIALQNNPSGEDLIAISIITALSIYGIHTAYRVVLPRFRRTAFYVTVPAVAAMYWLIIMGAVVLTIIVLRLVVNGSPALALENVQRFFTARWEPLVWPFVIAIGLIFVLELSRRVGPGRLLGWLLGRYRTPREEQRIFLLIDLRDSTPIAEKLGALQFSYLLRDFFDELTQPVLDTGGEIVSYVGDEAIISWPVKRGLEDANALQCFLLFREEVASHAWMYKRDYGLVPGFKAALHAGPIVVTEVGQLRTDVVFHGDALNTAARVLGECNAKEADLLVSDSIAGRLPPIDGVQLVDLGPVHLKGKEEPVGLFALRPA